MQTSNNSNHNRRRPVASINVTPLVDVLLILLVVLMLSMPMFIKRLPVELPKTDLSGTPTPMKSLAVSIAKDGRLQLKETPAQLESVLAQIQGSTTVELSVDKDASYEKLAVVVSAIQMRNPKEIILLTR